MKAGWQKKPLSEVCVLVNGRAYKKDELLDSGKYPVLRVGNFFTNSHWYHSDLELDTDKYCDKGDLLYAWSASFGPRIWGGEKVIYHYHIWKVLPNPSLVEKKFLFRLLEWDVDQIKQAHGTGTTMMHVSKGSMENRIVLIPPLPEQQRIVAILDEAFAGIATAAANAEKNLNNARELFDAHVQRFFFNTEAGWEEKKLTDVVSELITGPFGSMLHKSDYVDDGIPVVNPQNIIGGKIIPLKKTMVSVQTRDRMAKYCLRENDIVIARRGEMGRCGIVDKAHAGWLCGTGSMVMRLKVNANVQYIAWLLQASTVRKRLEGDAIGATMSNLNQAILLSVKFRLPPLHAQQTIVAKLGEISTETKRLEAIYQQKLAALDELKESLLQQAFSGEL